MRATVAALVGVLVLTGCTAGEPDTLAEPTPSVTGSTAPASPEPASPGSASPATSEPTPAEPTPAQPTPAQPTPAEPTPAEPTPAEPGRFRAGTAMRDVRALAGDIGPRPATGPGFREAGRLVERRLERLGYAVRRQTFPVPAGDSWGVPVAAGRSFNVVAEPPGFRPRRPHLLLGAHLDTVAVAPGAEDNASGVAALLELARLAAARPTRLPVVLVAFGAEEPVGPGDALHHFGSQAYVAQAPPRRLEALQAMVSLDRVGVGGVVPVCTGPTDPGRVAAALRRAGRRAGVPTRACTNTASDHWSFEKAGVPAARLGSTSYAEYHSAADLPGVVNPAQLRRTGRLAWAWLR